MPLPYVKLQYDEHEQCLLLAQAFAEWVDERRPMTIAGLVPAMASGVDGALKLKRLHLAGDVVYIQAKGEKHFVYLDGMDEETAIQGYLTRLEAE